MREPQRDSNGRFSGHGLAERVDALRDLVDERDRRYHERDEDIKRNLAVALTTAKEATDKAERRQGEYNATHNDLLHRLDFQAAMFIKREDYDREHKGLQELISSRLESLVSRLDVLERQSSHEAGLIDRNQMVVDTHRWIIAQLIATVGVFAVLLGHILKVW